jgi:threonine/homoserine/homoserine lactone efflux protein
MLDAGLLLPFLVAVFLVLTSPGPTVTLMLSTGISQGTSAALYTGLGISAAVFTSSLITMFGLATLITTVPSFLIGVQLFGVLYLLYLAFREWRKVATELSSQPLSTGSRHFWQGFLVDTLNPGSLLFLIGFLPQFVNPELGHIKLQLFLLSLLYTVCDLSFNVVLAYLSGRASRRVVLGCKFVTLRRYGLATLYAGLAFYFVVHSY